MSINTNVEYLRGDDHLIFITHYHFWHEYTFEKHVWALTQRETDLTTVTLAAHAHRGLKISNVEKTNKKYLHLAQFNNFRNE